MPHPSARRQWPQVDHGSMPRRLLGMGRAGRVLHQKPSKGPHSEAELAKLLASRAVTQEAINHAGLCDGRERPPVLSSAHSTPPPQLRPLSRRLRGRVRRRALPPRPARCDRGGHARQPRRVRPPILVVVCRGSAAITHTPACEASTPYTVQHASSLQFRRFPPAGLRR